MATKTISTRKYKKQKLRNAEYYQMQEILDQLYEDSLQNKNFKNLYDLIVSEENIKLAFRTIKNNKGSYTRGCNKTNIINIKENEVGKVIKYVRNRLEDFRPHKVRRVFIPKPDGRLRPLGIPSIEDRLIQQCFKQILEPICEAKFYKHSYGFRPNRSTKHAIARVHQLINTSGMKYCVDIDLKSFFDNVNHGKLLKQIWSLGIRDKKVISIISKMLKAKIEGEGIPTKGIPQGGILSPLLANIVLNEMDWWIASQWETFPINKEYANDYSRIRHLRENTKLKEIHLVRYADDFKIFCKDYETASRINIATRKWLKERLQLEVNEEKSRIINLQKNYSNFLGIKLKVRNKKNRIVVTSHIAEKSQEHIKRIIKERAMTVHKTQNPADVIKLNATILGIHNYYNVATNISSDMNKINYQLERFLNKVIGQSKERPIDKNNKVFQKFYGNYKGKIRYCNGKPIFPINYVKTCPPMNFNPEINDYTEKGRQLIHAKLKGIDMKILRHIMENPNPKYSMEYNDNRISLYVAQQGLCAITQTKLTIGMMECHHKKPKRLKGTDEYQNLIWLNKEIHQLIHTNNKDEIKRICNKFKLNETQIKKVNKLRSLVGNDAIA